MKKHHMTVDDAFILAFPKLPHYSVCLKGLRVREGLTQVQFAKALGVTQRNVSDIERGIRLIETDLAKKISSQFNIDYRIFL